VSDDSHPDECCGGGGCAENGGPDDAHRGADDGNPNGGAEPVVPGQEGIDRRGFITGAAAGGAALAAALSPLRNYTADMTVDQFMQAHYKELSGEELEVVLKNLEKEVEEKYGKKVDIKAPPPEEDVKFVYALNIGRCIGCRRCVEACVKENNCSRSPEVQYIRVLRLRKGTMNLEEATHDYDPKSVPEDGFFYMPVQCHQCEDAPCVKVCPVEATWTEDDGITVVDYDWCIGCRYCEAACPYWARRFNFTEPEIPKEELNPNMSYLSNRPRQKGVMEKCTFCLHRTREGENPACLEVCPTGARVFGNALDPESPVRQILEHKRVFVLKEDVGTLPRFFYFFDK
jgi:molybdopterin-containing oxidoreductase family iron-sulfur binding subunit